VTMERKHKTTARGRRTFLFIAKHATN